MTSLPEMVRQALMRDPASAALAFDGTWHGWGALRRVAEAVAGAVSQAIAEAGLAADAAQTVAFVARNRPEAVAALLGLLADGRSIRMIYPFQSGEAIAAALSRPDITAVVMHRADHGPCVAAAARRAGLATILLDGMAPPSVASPCARRHATLPGAGAPAPVIEVLTSGTTGPPKHFPVAFSLIEQHFVSTPLTRNQGDDPAAAPPFLLYFPLGNITGLYATLPTLLRGQRAILLERFSLSAWHDYVKTWRPAHSGVPPSAIRQIMDAQVPVEDLASIKAMGIGAAPLSPELQSRFETRYGIPILLAYGATEFAGPVAMMTAQLHATWGKAKLGSVGKPLAGMKLRVVDPDTGCELPPGREGLLHVLCPRVGPDWIATSDLAVIDADGFLFLKGRADGAIMRGGFKVLPETVEGALMLHPAIADAAVVGIEDSRLGQVPAAAVEIAPGSSSPSVAELEAHLRRHLLATQIPAHWHFCDALPRTPSLKADRSAVKSLFK